MAKTMTKYQLDHFKQKVKRHFDPLIEEQELLVKQYRTEATKKIVGKLAKKMGADKILNEFKKAEAQLKTVQDKARTFFRKKAEQDKELCQISMNATSGVHSFVTNKQMTSTVSLELSQPRGLAVCAVVWEEGDEFFGLI